MQRGKQPVHLIRGTVLGALKHLPHLIPQQLHEVGSDKSFQQGRKQV